jgi:hypothetical protein
MITVTISNVSYDNWVATTKKKKEEGELGKRHSIAMKEEEEPTKKVRDCGG